MKKDVLKNTTDKSKWNGILKICQVTYRKARIKTCEKEKQNKEKTKIKTALKLKF